MKKRIFICILLSCILVLTLSVSLITAAVWRSSLNEQKNEIREKTGYLAAAYNEAGYSCLPAIGSISGNRITLVSAEGAVLYDDIANADNMGNHIDRPEIAQALAQGTGEAVRESDTLSEKMYYYAIRLDDGCVVRLSCALSGLASVFRDTSVYIAIVAVCALIVSALMARILTGRIVRPINEIDPEKPLEGRSYPEFAGLLVRLDKQNAMIERQIEEITKNAREFSEIANEIEEPLVIFSTDRKVMFANKSAKALFDKSSTDGISYLELCRDRAFTVTVEEAFAGKTAEAKLSRGSGVYRLSASPVTAGAGSAAVLFAADITLSEQAEQQRREFSANVSHELRTPLTTIMGSAELMLSGIAPQEDHRHLLDVIYSESHRMLLLIEDIIRLSKLDEGCLDEEFTDVDLHAVAADVAAGLEDKAQKAGVSISLTGDTTVVRGIENTIHEMIFNLCDNAIAYNHAGGWVRVSVGMSGNKPEICVEDNGIGISARDTTRIFERFYRVDKSRSKQTGGTGLGLSIVKHGAQIHHAQIGLVSAPGEGTKITLTFPAGSVEKE